jgi:hypothetical protein
MNERQKRLIEVYEYLRSNCGIHTKTGFAETLHYGRTSMSAAMNGDEKYLTDKLLTNICESYPGVFNLDYLLTGEGTLLAVREDGEPDNSTNSNVDWQQVAYDTMKSQIEDLRARLEEKQIIIDSQKREIELLNMRIRGMELEMQMNGVGSYPFGVGAALKSSAPDKI